MSKKPEIQFGPKPPSREKAGYPAHLPREVLVALQTAQIEILNTTTQIEPPKGDPGSYGKNN